MDSLPPWLGEVVVAILLITFWLAVLSFFLTRLILVFIVVPGAIFGIPLRVLEESVTRNGWRHWSTVAAGLLMVSVYGGTAYLITTGLLDLMYRIVF